jgi:hypothetical protein
MHQWQNDSSGFCLSYWRDYYTVLLKSLFLSSMTYRILLKIKSHFHIHSSKINTQIGHSTSLMAPFLIPETVMILRMSCSQIHTIFCQLIIQTTMVMHILDSTTNRITLQSRNFWLLESEIRILNAVIPYRSPIQLYCNVSLEKLYLHWAYTILHCQRANLQC